MILMKDIIQEGHETLYKVAKEVTLPISEEDMTTLKDMLEFVINSQNPEESEKYSLRPAVGIAAPQINISKRMFVIALSDGKKEHIHAVVNPKITKKSNNIIYLKSGEGCLSVDDDISGLVPRYEWIEIETHELDLNTGLIKKARFKLKGYPAIVFQHEFDHLEGIVFTDIVKEEIEGTPIE